MLSLVVHFLLLAAVFAALPTKFSWANNQGINFLSPSQNQNNPHRCESGWAFATINTLNTRLNLQMNKQSFLAPANSLSVQVLLECDGYDYGCLGVPL
jgi:hypothetical protein